MKDWKSSMDLSKRNTSPVMNTTKLSRRPRVHSIKYWKVHKHYSMFLKKKVLSSIRRKLPPWETLKPNEYILRYIPSTLLLINIDYSIHKLSRYITSSSIKHQQFKFQNHIHIFISQLNSQNQFI